MDQNSELESFFTHDEWHEIQATAAAMRQRGSSGQFLGYVSVWQQLVEELEQSGWDILNKPTDPDFEDQLLEYSMSVGARNGIQVFVDSVSPSLASKIEALVSETDTRYLAATKPWRHSVVHDSPHDFGLNDVESISPWWETLLPLGVSPTVE